LRTDSDYDHAAVFSNYHHFAWLPREHVDPNDPMVPSWAHNSIEAALLRKGFSVVSDTASADFVVDFTIGSREQIEVQSYPTQFGIPYRNYEDWWAARYWGAGIDGRQYREGTLSIDIFDARTHKPVWHGWAQKELTRANLKNPERPIRAAVDAVLAHFPP